MIDPAVLVVHGADDHAHEVPAGHPDRPERLDAVRRGIGAVDPDLVDVMVARAARPEDLTLAHTPAHVAAIRELSRRGGGPIDDDTYVSRGTFDAALGAVGAGLAATAHLLDRSHAAAFAVTRPPGHHANASTARGFCIFNNIAVTAAHLASTGSRVTIIDWDAHHGDGTQEIFWSVDRVQYVSVHQESLYPGTGMPHERGAPGGRLTTMNLPLPERATGDRYLALLDDPVAHHVARFSPDWVLISCGFDAHIDDPHANMALRGDDFAQMTERVAAFAPGAGRLVMFLEGGYDLAGLESSTAAVVATLAGTSTADRTASTGGPGVERVYELRRLWA